MQAPFAHAQGLSAAKLAGERSARALHDGRSVRSADQSNSTNNYAIIRPAFNPLPQSNLQQLNERYQPWGGNPRKQATGLAYSMAVKDPLVRSSDDWAFPTSPTNKFPNIGWLGRVHRGTPWQTIYLKSEMVPMDEWTRLNGDSPALVPHLRPHAGTHPPNDWKFLDLFTVAPNANAARGLLCQPDQYGGLVGGVERCARAFEFSAESGGAGWRPAIHRPIHRTIQHSTPADCRWHQSGQESAAQSGV
jgi:hypothetical protein